MELPEFGDGVGVFSTVSTCDAKDAALMLRGLAFSVVATSKKLHTPSSSPAPSMAYCNNLGAYPRRTLCGISLGAGCVLVLEFLIGTF